MLDLNFFKDKKVFVTGHTGFKGSWLCRILINAGADVTGYSLEPPTMPNLFEISGIKEEMKSVIGDIRDLEKLKGMAYEDARAELVRLPGIGGKVADCICLFALHQMDAFPVDTHIKKALELH